MTCLSRSPLAASAEVDRLQEPSLSSGTASKIFKALVAKVLGDF